MFCGNTSFSGTPFGNMHDKYRYTVIQIKYSFQNSALNYIISGQNGKMFDQKADLKQHVLLRKKKYPALDVHVSLS